MKFLCRNCKAKYQIADEKVAGRALRMTCQQCGETIVVRGAAGRAPSASVARPAAATALSADFQRQLSVPAREISQPLHDEWHVAINDVPLGPMRRDEVARKIAMGAVGRESLAWREGMDDWLAIKHIAELSVLLSPSSPDLNAAPASPPSAAAPAVAAAPAARAEMAPIGGRQVVGFEDYAREPEPELPEVAVATVASLPAEAPAAARQLGWGPMFALVSGGAFILAAGAFLGVRVLAPSTPAPVAPSPAAAAAPPPSSAPAIANGQPSGSQNNVIELDMQAIDGTSNGARRPPNAPVVPPAAAPDKKGKALTDEQRAMLERMGGGFNQGPSNIRAPSEVTKNPNQPAGQLTAQQLQSVVVNGKKNLQRCYETALRGANSTDTVRLDVDIEVSPSGNVTSVHAAGKGLPGMDECITRTVKMWRFPMSGEATQTRFPVVFQPGA